MALRQTTQRHTTEAQLFVLPTRDGAIDDFTPGAEETVMDQSLSDQPQIATRKLRGAIILANILAWIAIVLAIRFAFF